MKLGQWTVRRNPSELRGLCKLTNFGVDFGECRNPSELRGLCK